MNRSTLHIFLFLCFFSVFFLFCSKENSDEIQPDPCLGIICENDGICIDGKCECKFGYKGLLCDSQITPLAISIDSVYLLSYPENNHGNPWDSADGPDIEMGIGRFNPPKSKFYGIVNNAIPNKVFLYKPTSPLVVDGTFEGMIISIDDFEYENNGSVYMSGIDFELYNDTNDFPVKLVLSNDVDFSVELFLSYIWQ